ncbi:hypothetical protein Q757_02015 [Oenococcus alcoholitolerans]|uniref:Uncharacterized protein n=1 Tax=Oenococcus alcoholitolerans TaxID=931074 RepID=A0ABR4XS04_9LACO|nr:hypothetical protein Q757_02015 [Oenococcus alcoholitolerans]
MTRLNLLINVSFNRAVAKNGALYWSKDSGDLEKLINKSSEFNSEDIAKYTTAAVGRVESEFTWENIIDKYEKRFVL